jgi:hypothetical protein
MSRHIPRGRLLGYCLVAAALVSGPGCLGFMHPMPPTPPECVAACRTAPQASRDHVHVFFVNGLDPLNKDNFMGLEDYVIDLGFTHCTFGQMVDTPTFISEVRRIHNEDPEARFVLVGFSFGTNMVRSITHAVQDDGITIDLLVYLGGDTILNTPASHPANATRVVNITAHGCVMLFGGYIWKGEDIDGAVNLRLTDVGHAGIPTHRQTLELVAHHLAEVLNKTPGGEAAPATPVSTSE